MSRVSVALSGGGHRATLFGLGVLLYLADAGKNREVTNIASVSGGSITNGFVAQQLDFATCSKEDFEKEVGAPLAEQIAQRGTLFAPLATKLYLIVLVLSSLATLVGPWFVPLTVWPRMGIFVVAVLWTAWLAGQRGNVCGAAYRKTLFSSGGSATRLSELQRKAYSVWCATDLRTARQFYFAPRFVYGHTLGWASPSDTPLYKAVQASAARQWAAQDPASPIHAQNDLSEAETQILALLQPEETHIDTLIEASQLPAHLVSSILVTLELRGLIHQFPGKLFARA